jgi:peptide/nickel transport system substrate-binding protein
MDAATYTAKQFQGEFDLISQGGVTAHDPDVAYYPDYHCEKIDPLSKRKRVNNVAGYCNPRVDRLLEEARRLTDMRERQKIYAEFLKIIHDELPQIPYMFYPYVFAHRPHVKGLEFDLVGQYFFAQGGIPMAWLEK